VAIAVVAEKLQLVGASADGRHDQFLGFAVSCLDGDLDRAIAQGAVPSINPKVVCVVKRTANYQVGPQFRRELNGADAAAAKIEAASKAPW
jgi:hypothetical protein